MDSAFNITQNAKNNDNSEPFDTTLPPIQYEYLDHPADVQLHSWGDTLSESFEQCAMAMFAYMTEIDKVDMLEMQEIEAQGHDLESLLFHFLDEFLFLFSAEPYFIVKKVKILQFDEINFTIRAQGFGEEFDLDKHPQKGRFYSKISKDFPPSRIFTGTEVKAITYSNMQVYDKKSTHDLFVIIDI